MTPEPLKDKKLLEKVSSKYRDWKDLSKVEKQAIKKLGIPYGSVKPGRLTPIYKEEDVRSAVEWLKENWWNKIKDRDVQINDVIDQAFPDLKDDGETSKP